MSEKQVQLSFLAIDPYIESHIVKPVEKDVRGKDFITWGENNDYPDYIEDLYLNGSTIRSVIDGTTDYIVGDGVTTKYIAFQKQVNHKGDTLEDIIKWISKDIVKFGGFALNIIRNKMGTVAEIYYLDFKRVRSNKDNTKLYYSTDWSKSYGRVKYIEYPSFVCDDKAASSIFYYKNDINYTYPISMFSAAIIACEIERKIDVFHLNNVNNNFTGSYIVNFNSGKPTDEQKLEIENAFYDKFTGVENAGRPMLSFNNSKVNETTITKVPTEDFADKYNALTDRVQQQIFTAVRATPNLFGIPTKTTGFSQQEYFEAYQLFYRTVIKPIQNQMMLAFDKITNAEDSVTIIPFKINTDEK